MTRLSREDHEVFKVLKSLRALLTSGEALMFAALHIQVLTCFKQDYL